ncbi:hypothetical protein F5X68DRAFT_230682 [Plectosphaerella plurivora]|uniref:DUF6546 domain-containing protein n=1 Tax=Plectosphaerella plurivora TaxID=936078 RepID=A0A9P8VFL2_9PEZI|nr:hypothetical protein F5X68DRAFT_230682 [Plectosphaerella plurivora]
MAGWKHLPSEIRLIIWDFAASDFANEPPKFGSLSAVCREWQDYFEGRNFSSLTIDQFDIPDFGILIQNGRLFRLRNLRLHILFPAYSCAESSNAEDDSTVLLHEMWFSKALFSLLDILATEENKLTQEEQSGPGFTLELSASSVSDGHHGFKDFRLSTPYEKLRRRNPHQPDLPFEQFHRSGSTLYPTCGNNHDFGVEEFDRVYGGRPLELQLGTGLQTPIPPRVVKMVTGLLTRRQSYRSVSIAALTFLMQNCFPSIVNLNIERWQAARVRHPEAETFLKELLHCPRELESFHIFEDRSAISLEPDSYSPTTDTGVSKVLWHICQFPKLQSFSACSVIDANDFFSHFSGSLAEEMSWPELRNLCLTAQYLMPTDSWTSDFSIPNETQAWKLLTDATKIASLMPKLEVMELWHAAGEMACIWTYYKTEHRARLMVRGGFEKVVLNEQPSQVQRLAHMAKTWAKYATELLGRHITCEMLLIPERCTNHYWSIGACASFFPCDIVYHLELANTILHPLSLQEMKWESTHDNHLSDAPRAVPKPVWTGDTMSGENDGESDGGLGDDLAMLQVW